MVITPLITGALCQIYPISSQDLIDDYSCVCVNKYTGRNCSDVTGKAEGNVTDLETQVLLSLYKTRAVPKCRPRLQPVSEGVWSLDCWALSW